MKKEIFNGQGPENINYNSLEIKSELVGQHVQETVKNIDEGLDLAISSGEVIKNSFPEESEISEVVDSANSRVGDEVGKSKNTILSSLRSSGLGRKFIQTAAVLGLLMGAEKFSRAEGVGPGKGKDLIENKDDREGRSAVLEVINPENNIEKNDSLQNPKPEDYDLRRYHSVDPIKEEKEKQEYKKALNNPELAKKIIEQKIFNRRIDKIGNELYFAKKDLKRAVKQENTEEINKKNQEISVLESQQQGLLSGKIKLELSPEEQACVNNAPTIFLDIELARNLALKGFEGEEYVRCLAKEFGISKEEAKKHQQVRLDNIKNCQINFFFQADGRGEYASYGANSLNVPVTSDNTVFNVEALTHEFRHAATDGDNGLSQKAKKILTDETFNQELVFNNDRFGKDYYGKSTERDVRKKALDDDLNLKGIKKYGEKFTKGKYLQMIEMYKNNPNNFSEDSQNFIKQTKDFDDPDKGYENFRKIFDELADNKEDNKNIDDTYYHPDWDYGSPDNKA